MGMYYQLIDPLIFTSTLAIGIGGIVQTTAGAGKNAGNSTQLASASGMIAFISFMFLIFNFQWSISAKRLNSIKQARKTYNAMYDNGTKYRGSDISGSMFLFAFMSFLAALFLFGLGVTVIMLADNNYIAKNGNNEYVKLPDDEKLSSGAQTYFYILGFITILCSIIALIRLPLDYLMGSIGVYWIMSIFFLY